MNGASEHAFPAFHVRRFARDPEGYWRWVFGPDSPLWQPSVNGPWPSRVAMHPSRRMESFSPYSTTLCAELNGLDARLAEVFFQLRGLHQAIIRDQRDLLVSGCHFQINWREALRELAGEPGAGGLFDGEAAITEEERAWALRAVWELFAAGARAALRPPPLRFRCGAEWDFSRPLLLGIVNVTPDSFSDGGKHLAPAAAVKHARTLAAQGADGLDLGAESTRPGSRGVPAGTQKARLLPVIRALRRDRALARIPLSIDTQSAEVFRACWGEGADLLNDVSALRRDRALAAAAARVGCPVILMHMLGRPRSMQKDPRYGDVAAELIDFFRKRLDAAARAGIPPVRVILDPGLGFGKTLEHNCELLRRLGEFKALGRPLLVGHSRKRFLGMLSGEEVPERRVQASVAAGLCAAQQGAEILRVHDVAEHARALAVAKVCW